MAAKAKGKRGNDEGSVYQRKDGVWCAALQMPDGKRRVLYGKTRKEAAEKLQTAQEAIRHALPVPSRRETLGAFLDRWLTDVAPLRVRPNTLQDYRGDVTRHITPALGTLKLADVTPARVQTFLNALTAQGMEPYSVQHVRAVLRSALSQAQREGLIGQNAAKLVSTPKAVRHDVAGLTPADAAAIIAALDGHELQNLVIVALATGARQGELLGLGWDDLDLAAGTLRIRQQLQRIDGAYQLTELKTATGRKTLKLPPQAVEALRREHAHQAAARLKAGTAWEETGRVFTTASGGYRNGSAVTHRVQDQLEAAGLSRLRFHHLRHGTASLLLAAGASLRMVMEQLGHSQIAVTMNSYAHIAPELMQENADRLERALGGR